MEEKVFNNLDGEKFKRRIITIRNQTGNVIEADVEFAEKIDENATPITAEVMNDFQSNIITAVTDSGTALKASERAESNSLKALEDSKIAEQNSILAKSVANNAKNSAEEALMQVTEKQGTKVYEGEALVSTFNADKKLDVMQSEANANKVMVTDAAGNVVPSSILQIGGFKLYSKINQQTGESSLVIGLSDEENQYE